MDYRGPLFRALHPYYAREPLSGEGARRFGGRFNRQGRAALYLARDFETLRYEIARGGAFQPSVIVEFRADISGLFDARDAGALASVGFAPDNLGDPAWRLRMHRGERVPTQDLAETLIGQGHCGMVVRSFARGARADSANVVLWGWGQGTAASLELVDDDGRLG
ncbi:RES family NAD+ phosphorylase [Psychromarinibacter sp. S121]|uniref:RES family NAD+ phosphorylase n=1 Tax=Psychromarinibacter sp. S121 TaxID=3415127 RepID=UPI003C7D5E88